ncbi:T9SS sorting signal type C domain-containing protein [Flavobacterium granuli]|uniref:Ig-like domain-containing protein n=1 Tax=Flavobacterium granuli TaxID=280093 RepID=A0ABU1S528_9FLAO|nr:T9SS sorting signal type C domain-containing protein [Flavobacterium granuli]MDR6845224.1 hypothetical protein [Flavobacterium granuli]
MNRILLKTPFFAFILLFFSFYGNAQCSISTTINTSTLTCGTAPLITCNGILYIGDGTNTMSLNINNNFDLSCLGPIQLIVRNNATLNVSAFTSLRLAEGSSIQFDSGSDMSGSFFGWGLYIGSSWIANDSGIGTGLTFDQIVSQGGYNPISVATNPATICGSGSSTLTATATLSGGTYKWYTTASGGSSIMTGSIYTTPTLSATTIYYVEAVYNGYTTTRKAVTVTVNPNPIANAGAVLTAICQGATSAAMGGSVSGTAIGGTWSGGAGTWTNPTNPSTATYKAGASESGVITLTLTTNGGTCGTTTVTKTITVNPSPVITSITPSATIICKNSTLLLTASVASGATAPYTYNWSSTGNSAGLAATNTTVNTNTATTSDRTDTKTYSVFVTDANSCRSSTFTTLAITVNNSTVTSETIIGGANTVCVNAVTPAFTGTPSGGTWLIVNGTGSASITPAGVVTGLTAGTATVEYKYTNGGGCTDIAIQSITINALPSITGASAVCVGLTTTLTGSGTPDATAPWTSATAAVATVSNTGVVTGVGSGTSVITYKNSNGCTKTVTVTVNALPTTPTGNATSQPTCLVSTGTITVTAPTGMNYSIDGSNYSNTTGVFNNVAVGVYSVTASNGTCASLGVPISIISPTNTWNGAKWSKTNDITPPTAGDIVVFDGNYSQTADIQGCSCQVNAGYTVTIPSGNIMTITNSVSTAGILIFENNSSLIQINNVANTGKIVYNRISAPMKNFDFTYWCSPVEGQVLNVLSPNTLSDKYQSYANGKWVIENGLNKMDLAKGFAIRVPKPNIHFVPNNEYWTGLTYAQPVKFVGVPNNGDITIDSQGIQKDNLIGNPYPSAIDADKFINENLDMIDGGLYFWTHNTAITQSGSFYVYSPNDYAVYLLTGGVKATSGGTVPGKTIAAGQSFFVTSKTTGVFKFNNAMRNTTAVLAPGSNSQFFRMSKTKKTESVDKSRVWLNLTNSDGIFKQLLVGYITGATNEMDNLYDAVSFDGNAYADFYSVNETNNLAIQGRTLPFDKTDKVPLGYRTTVAGTFQISIDNVDGELTNQTVFLEDNLTKTIHNLKNGPYSFTTVKGTFNDRFALVYVDKTAVAVEPPAVVDPPVMVEPPVVVDPPVMVEPSVAVEPPAVVDPLVTVEPPAVANLPVIINPPMLTPPVVALDPKWGNSSFDKKDKSVIVSINNHQIKINSFDKIMDVVIIYDLKGRELYRKNHVNSNEFVILNFNSSEKFLIVMTQLSNGKWIAKAIIF